MKLALSIALMLFVSAVPADDQIVGPKVTESFTHAKHMNDPPEILPAMYRICAALGIEKDKCTDAKYASTFTIQGHARTQTDKSLWYGGGYSYTVPPSDAECPGAIPVSHYVTWDGAIGTSYVCLVAAVDDTITESELAAIARYAEHANSIGKKTLEDHEIAMQVKQMADWLADPKR